ncbi:MAG: ATP-binding protein [Pseudomonadota bacterium]|nr:ATP-binding protein [Pseudomonadota bacterium]
MPKDIDPPLPAGPTGHHEAIEASSPADVAERYRMILNNAKDGIIALSPRGLIDGVNPAIERMFGYAEDQLHGQTIGLLYEDTPTTEQIGSFLNYVRSRGGDTSAYKFGGKRVDGTTLLCDVAVTPMELSDGTHFVAIVRDITESNRIEEMKSEFVATVSHELRTPLTSIAGSLGLLAAGAGGALSPTAAKLIKIAHENSERLVRLINDILDIEKIESGKMPFTLVQVPLEELVQKSIDATSGFAAKFGIELLLRGSRSDAIVGADPDRLMQVMSNLLSNAIKFSPPAGSVMVEICKIAGNWRVSVSNDGEGIPEVFKDRIFSRFAQADGSSTRERGGTGLGLNIVKEIVTRMDGTVGFESEPDQGATFYFDLPPASEESNLLTDEVLVCVSSRRDPPLSIPPALRARVAVAETPEKLVELVSARRFSAVILDLGLTDQCRLEIIASVRNNPISSGTPIIALSVGAAGQSNASSLTSVLNWLATSTDQKSAQAGAIEGGSGIDDSGETRILHVEDDEDLRELVAGALGTEIHTVGVATLEQARAAIAKERYQLVILDLKLGQENGLELLPDLRRLFEPPIPVVIFTANDVAADSAREVSAVLTKTRASLRQLVATVTSLINLGAHR